MRKFIAFIIAGALVFPLILASQALISVNSFVLDRNFYIDVLNTDQVYDSLLSGKTLSNTLKGYLPLPEDTDFSQMEVVLKSVISREFMKEQVAAFVNGLFDYMQGKTETFSPVIDLIPIKTMLAEEKLDEMLKAIADALPVCELGQIPGIDFENQKACKPAGINEEVLVQNFLKPVFPFILAIVPNEIPIGEKLEEIQATRNWGPFASGMALPASLMLVAVFLTFVAAGLWYFAALIASESWRLRLLWLGWMLIVPSALILLAGIAFSTNIPGYWINLAIERAGMNGIPFGTGIRESLRAVVNGSFAKVAASFMMVGGISSAIGVGLIFWGLATKK